MNYQIRRPWDLPQREHTPEEIFRERGRHRREFLTDLGRWGLLLGGASWLTGCGRATPEELQEAGGVPTAAAELPKLFPAKRNAKFEYGRDETVEVETAEFTNFYEFSTRKDSWKKVGKFQPDPWQVEVTGLCEKPQKFDLDDLYSKFSHEERHYRHRCVETWAMCVPWTGFSLSQLLKRVEPKSSARFVKFETFVRKDQAPNQHNDYPWPYSEGLTLPEAMNDLAFLAVGIYGHPLPRQNGAPIRLVLPWKYGFKSIKSIVKIELTDKQPATFWNTLIPEEYGFEANVDPEVPHPRWSQRTEWMLGTRERFSTRPYNGYGEYVGGLYAG